MVALEGWVKVRDMAGAPLAWVERKALGDKRFVVVKAPVADVLAAGDAGPRCGAPRTCPSAPGCHSRYRRW